MATFGQKWPLCAQKVPKNPTTAKLVLLRGAPEATWSFSKQRMHENRINPSTKWPKQGPKGRFLTKNDHFWPEMASLRSKSAEKSHNSKAFDAARNSRGSIELFKAKNA
jgi:hypothetical protein